MRLVLAVLIAGVTVGSGGGAAQAYLVHGADGRLVGLLPGPGAAASRSVHGPGPGAAHRVRYWGGSVMLSTNLHLIFWGPPDQFGPGYQDPITRWAQGLAADSGTTTNEFSVASLYYTTSPRRQISRNIYFAGAVADPNPYPASGCRNPHHPQRTCLRDAQLRAEIAEVGAAQDWPADNPRDPRNQYLLFTPAGVDVCQYKTTCTFSGQDSICGYHSSFPTHGRAVVYAILPEVPSCPSGQAPDGAGGNPLTDGTIDSAIHEVVESATDPGSRGPDDWAWADGPGNEVGDLCSLGDTTVYGVPLGGLLSAHSAFNQVIAGEDYYTQEIWAIGTGHRAAGCVQRVGPTPVFKAAPATVNTRTSFEGSRSYDLAGTITRFTWNYGDGSRLDTTHGPRGDHVYRRPGVYQVSLTVRDASGPRNASTETQAEVVK